MKALVQLYIIKINITLVTNLSVGHSSYNEHHWLVFAKRFDVHNLVGMK